MSEIKSGDRVEILDKYNKHEGFAEVISFNPDLNTFIVRFEGESTYFSRKFGQVKPVVQA